MQEIKEEIIKKIGIAKDAAGKLTLERDQLMAQIAPLKARLDKVVFDLDYWTRRIEKLNKGLS